MIRRIVKWLVFKCIYPFCYWMGSRKKVDSKKVIFVENHQDYLTDNFALLYEELQQNGFELHTHYLQVASSEWKDIIIRSLALIQDMSDAVCIFLDESNSLFGAFSLRKETKMVQVWHACGAFKKWGYSVADKSFGEDMDTLKKYSGHRNYTLVPISGEEVCWAYEEAFGLKQDGGVVRPLGVSRTDVFFDEEKKQLARKQLDYLDFSFDGRKILVYLPTFRGDISHAKAPDKLDMEKLYELREEYVLLIKNHPFVKERMDIPEQYRDFCMEITDEMTVEELMFVSDICITDYSSVVFEFSLLQKPILFFAHDLESYYDERGFYYPYEELVPGPILKSTEELLDCIYHINNFDYGRLENFRKRFMSGCDGHSTDRIIAELFDTESEENRRK
ncbi:MAG: CDP-glycerol glycerophosphotransferase family protein [Lachnospiraceae bacterium]